MLFALFLLAVAAQLFSTGLTAWHQFHPQDPARLVCALPPILLATGLVSLMVWLPFVSCRGKIQLDLMGVHYYRGQGASTLHFPWTELLITAPRPGQKSVLRKMVLINRALSSSDTQVILYDLFLPHFDELTSVLALHRQRQTRSKNSVLPLD